GEETGDGQLAPTQPLGTHERERRPPPGLALRPRDQRGRTEPDRQTPELLPPDDARDRLAGEATAGERVDLRRLVAGQRPFGRGGECRVIEGKRMADEHAGVELGRIETGGAGSPRPASPPPSPPSSPTPPSRPRR